MARDANGDVMGAIKSDLDALREDLRTLAGDVSALRGVAANGAKREFDHATGAIGDMLENTGQAVAEQAREHVSSARNAVKDNPLTALAVAFGLGVLLSRAAR